MPEEQVISGTIIYGDELEVIDGYLCIRDHTITEIGTGNCVDADLTGLVAPGFVNAHTHIGDSVLKDPPLTDLDSLIKPPLGIKHRVLRSTSAHDLKTAMYRTIEDMAATGTCTFCDFREGGLTGASLLNEVLTEFQGITCLIMGRADNPESPESEELTGLLGVCSGIGISGANDVPLDIITDAANISRMDGKMFAIHAGEKDHSDISTAIELEPDFIVHMTYATDLDIKNLGDSDIPVVVCPRSNFITRVGAQSRPPVQKMLDRDINVGVGTDNVMLNSVNMFSEMEFLSKVYGLDDRQVFKMCTLNGAKILGLDKQTGSILEGKLAKLMVLDNNSSNLSNSSDLIASLVRRGRPDDLKAVMK